MLSPVIELLWADCDGRIGNGAKGRHFHVLGINRGVVLIEVEDGGHRYHHGDDGNEQRDYGPQGADKGLARH